MAALESDLSIRSLSIIVLSPLYMDDNFIATLVTSLSFHFLEVDGAEYGVHYYF